MQATSCRPPLHPRETTASADGARRTATRRVRGQRRSALPPAAGPVRRSMTARSLFGYEHHLDERLAADWRKTYGGAGGEVLRKRPPIGVVHCGEVRHVG